LPFAADHAEGLQGSALQEVSISGGACGELMQSPAGRGEGGLKKRDDFVANAIAENSRVGIRGIQDYRERESRAVRRRLMPPDVEKRSQSISVKDCHRAQPGQSRAAESAHQHGLGLVIGGVAERNQAGPRLPLHLAQGE
jgi:hypothetical protein